MEIIYHNEPVNNKVSYNGYSLFIVPLTDPAEYLYRVLGELEPTRYPVSAGVRAAELRAARRTDYFMRHVDETEYNRQPYHVYATLFLWR